MMEISEEMDQAIERLLEAGRGAELDTDTVDDVLCSDLMLVAGTMSLINQMIKQGMTLQ